MLLETRRLYLSLAEESVMSEMERCKKAVEDIAGCVCKDRHDAYGTVEDNFGRIAALASIALGKQFTPADVAVFMACVKIARLANNPKHRDSWIDLAGYGVCGAALIHEETAAEAAGQGAEAGSGGCALPGVRDRETPAEAPAPAKTTTRQRKAPGTRIPVEPGVPDRSVRPSGPRS